MIFDLFGVRTICPTPKQGNEVHDMKVQNTEERREGGEGGVRTCVGVGGRVNKIFEQKATKMSTYST